MSPQRPYPAPPSGHPGAPAPPLLEFEDVVLAAWLAALYPYIRRYTGDNLLPLIDSLDLRLMEMTWDTRWAWLAQPGVVMGGVFCLTLVPLAIALRAASMPSRARRALLVPAALVGVSVCGDAARTFGDGADHAVATLIAVHLLATLLAFVLLVAAPRIVAGATRGWRLWVPRGALFYTAWWAGALAGW